MPKKDSKRFFKGDSGDRHTFGEDMAEDYPVKGHTRGGKPVKKHTRGEGLKDLEMGYVHEWLGDEEPEVEEEKAISYKKFMKKSLREEKKWRKVDKEIEKRRSKQIKKTSKLNKAGKLNLTADDPNIEKTFSLIARRNKLMQEKNVSEALEIHNLSDDDYTKRLKSKVDSFIGMNENQKAVEYLVQQSRMETGFFKKSIAFDLLDKLRALLRGETVDLGSLYKKDDPNWVHSKKDKAVYYRGK